MELALYHPEFGYYRRNPSDVFGLHGDFYTAGQLQPVFGDLLSTFVATLHQTADPQHPFEVLDLGAGQQDLRTALSPWNYRAFDWNTAALPSAIAGVIIANEFFDALPMDLLRKWDDQWRELVVKADGERFVFEEVDTVSPELLEYAQRYGTSVPENGILEINLAAKQWIKKLSTLLTLGSVLIIDYGYEARELVRFPEGTLLGYRKHSTADHPLAKPGEKDLTAHVNFTCLRDCALEAGFQIKSQSSLGSWALSVWDEREFGARWSKADERWRLQWKQLVFGMGDTFRVLHLEK